MVLGFAAVTFVFYKIVKFVYNLLFGKVVINQTDYEEGWFGRGSRPDNTNSIDTSIQPFKIHVPDEVLTDLKKRLQRARFEPPLEDAKFEYGFNSNYLQSIVEYWKTEFDWRKQEEQLNKFPHFKTFIEGINVHFVHVKSAIPEGRKLEVIPILITHGWPGSFYEFHKLIPLLTTVNDDKGFVFEVVCPSIPGYGFSESPCQKGFNARATARIFVTLMERLGHKRFYIQGGDWGSFVSQQLGKFYPERIIGVHLNMFSNRPKTWDFLKAVVIAYFPSLISKEEYKVFYPFKEKMKFLLQETGYFHIQSTKPDTVGCAMADSPVGLAAYILEKFSTWTDKENRSSSEGNLTKKFTLDELLTNIMIYWVNNNFTASARYYKENIGDRDHEKIPLTIPCGIALFPNEIVGMPRCLTTQSVTQLMSYTVMPRGGHFAAFEEPQLLAEDIWKFVAIVRKMN
ncbi:Epoxide hydrolase 1 like protein [Argiope bruennichi]|uniref:Epoxide hydrolase n=1 Tax=Argiope bruennichi TaxID=94029 RepID=A0A8T0E6P3_ARGBR|nr:Epoxide hydrolase 1 like protein [Argiope bruennichi]